MPPSTHALRRCAGSPRAWSSDRLPFTTYRAGYSDYQPYGPVEIFADSTYQRAEAGGIPMVQNPVFDHLYRVIDFVAFTAATPMTWHRRRNKALLPGAVELARCRWGAVTRGLRRLSCRHLLRLSEYQSASREASKGWPGRRTEPMTD